MRAKKRFWIVFDAGGEMYRSWRVCAPNRKIALRMMKVIYGDSVRVRTIEAE